MWDEDEELLLMEKKDERDKHWIETAHAPYRYILFWRAVSRPIFHRPTREMPWALLRVGRVC